MSEKRHYVAKELRRRIKIMLSQSTDILKERVASNYIFVIESISTVHDNSYLNSSREVSSIYYSQKGFQTINKKEYNDHGLLTYHRNQRKLENIDIDNEYLSVILDYDSPYFGRKLKSQIKKEISKIIKFDKHCFSLLIEEKDSVVNVYYWIRLTNNSVIHNENIWVKSRTLDFKSDDLFCKEVQTNIKNMFGIELSKQEVSDNLDEVMDYFKLHNY